MPTLLAVRVALEPVPRTTLRVGLVNTAAIAVWAGNPRCAGGRAGRRTDLPVTARVLPIPLCPIIRSASSGRLRRGRALRGGGHWLDQTGVPGSPDRGPRSGASPGTHRVRRVLSFSWTNDEQASVSAGEPNFEYLASPIRQGLTGHGNCNHRAW